MKLFNILTIFPEMFDYVNHSILKNAVKNKIVEYNIVNIRDYATNKHKNTDDYPYGGGQGMIMTCQPIVSSLKALKNKGHVIYMSPKGCVLNQAKALQLAKKECLTIICGRYEGIDQRIIDNYVDEQISIGDYVVTGGEIPALVLIDSISRLYKDVIKEDSYINESHYDSLLEHEQYTRPEIFENLKVPKELISGNHKLIDKYNKANSLKITFLKRPDLLKKRGISKKEANMLIEQFSDKKNDIIKLIKE